MCIRDRNDMREGGASGPRPFALPGAEPRYARDREVKVRHIRLDVALDFERKRIDGAATIAFAALNDGLRRITLDAVELEIGRVSFAGGEGAAFRHDGEKLEIAFPRPLAAGEEASLTIEYGGRPRRGLYFVGPEKDYPETPLEAWTQGQDEDSRHWFPCYDYPNERATSEVVATVPKRMFALSNGRLVKTEENEAAGTRTFHWSLGTPHVAYLVTLVAGEFDTEEDDLDGLPVLYLVPKGRAGDIRRSFGKTPAMIRHFEEITGVKYPYEKYAQVCVANFIFDGMENTTATTLTDRTLHDERAHEDQDSDSLVAHELAHQWFGDLLTCKDWANGWLNEGFATYLEVLWREKDKGPDEARYALWREAESYFEEDRTSYRRPIVTRVFKDPIEVFDRHLYEKGALVLDMLRHVLGDGLFFKAVRHYTGKHRGETVVTADLAKAVEEATGRNIEAFLDQWVHHGGHPELEVSYEWDEEGGLAKVTVKQTQKEDDVTPLFRMPVEIGFRTAEGAFTAERVEILPKKEQTFHVRLSAKPKTVRFDPGNRLLKTLKLKLGEDMLRDLLAADPDAMLRIRAARALGEKGSPAAVEALAKALREEKWWFVKAEIAKALGEVRSEAALAGLLSGLETVTAPKARRAIVEALGEFRDERAAEALSKVLAGDATYLVESAAASALGKTRSPRAFDAILGAIDRPSQADVLRGGCLTGLGELRDPRGIEVCERYARYGAPALARPAAIAALGKLGKEHFERREAVRDTLERLLDDPFFRAQFAVPKAIEALGDTAAIRALERTAERALDGRVRRRAAEAVRKLARGKHRDEEVRTLRDDFDRLKEDHRMLRDQLDRLEKTLRTGLSGHA